MRESISVNRNTFCVGEPSGFSDGKNMSSLLNDILKGATFSYNGHQFPLSPDYISILHHWYFGLTKEYYRSKDKRVILPDIQGHLIEIKDIGDCIDQLMLAYNSYMSERLNQECQ